MFSQNDYGFLFFFILVIIVFIGIPSSFYIGSSDCKIVGEITNLEIENDDLYLTIDNETYKFLNLDSDIIYNHTCEIYCTHFTFYDDCYTVHRVIYR